MKDPKTLSAEEIKALPLSDAGALVSISRNNRKVGAIPSFSLPVGVTCAAGCSCLKKCYAARMARIRPSVGDAWARNLTLWQERPDAVRQAVIASALLSSYFRYFVGGDIPDAAFLQMMVEVARAVPSCRFLAFTKKYDLINAYLDEGGELPQNLQIIFSEWKNHAPNPHALPLSRVIFKGEDEPPGAMVCGGNCGECICKGIACWALKSGDIIHFHEH